MNMKPKWIIEDFHADNSFGQLADEVKRQGMECEVLKYEPFQSGSYDVFGNEGCVIFQGSIEFALQLQREKAWIPGPWLTAKNYECTTYYAHFGKYLFNDRYTIMPRAEVGRRFNSMYDSYFGNLESLFFRPNSGLKPFTAGVYHRLNFPSFWGWVDEFTKPDDLVVISTPKDIKGEWRFVCANHQIITGCQYERDGELSFKEGYDTDAKILADQIAKEEFEPDPIYIIDICQAGDNKFYLMEINSFSCGGLYAMEMEPIVKSATELALKDWKECND